MNPEIEKLKAELEETLLIAPVFDSLRQKLAFALKNIEDTVQQLNRFIHTNGFENEQEEIDFFKYIKPEILALKIQEITQYNLTVNRPIGTTEIICKYLEDEMKVLQSFFRLNAFHYQYFKNGVSAMDSLYFLRSAGPPSIPLSEIGEIDTEFSTAMTFLFAKFIAYERVQYFILEQLTQLRYPDSGNSKSPATAEDIKWTGETLNIVELAYGLWLTGQLNNGNASLNQIVRWLESNLHVSIGIIQRKFSEIEKRKRTSPTKYINQMRDAILEKMDANNE